MEASVEFYGGLVIGFFIGLVFTWLWMRGVLGSLQARLSTAHTQLDHLMQTEGQLRQEVQASQQALAALRTQQTLEKQHLEEKILFLKDAQQQLSLSFKAACAEAITANQSHFSSLTQAHFEQWRLQAEQGWDQKTQAMDQLVSPLKGMLTDVQAKIDMLEKARQHAYGGLSQQVQSLIQTQFKLETETRHLSQALRNPQLRGQWGEVQLKRLVELSGMLPYVDFEEQVVVGKENARLRPDMLIHLPNGCCLAIDAKAPMSAYLEALEATTEAAGQAATLRHAQQVKARMVELGSKGYWKELKTSPEFVILFLPAEPFLTAALSQQPDLLEWGNQHGVILATPSTLLALLKTIAYGWKQEALAQEALAISTLGKELYERIATVLEYWSDLKKALEKANLAYNKALSSIETRIIPTAKKLHHLHASTQKQLPHLEKLPVLLEEDDINP